jgi:hypothetical protein
MTAKIPISSGVVDSAPRGAKKSVWDRSPVLMVEDSIEMAEPIKKKLGRPTKVDVVKEKAMKASAEIRALVASKPSSKDISEWIKKRLAELNADMV